MSFYLYNAAPGRMYYLGNEITAEPGVWTEVSEYAVNHGTFNAMKRMKMAYVVEANSKPTYDPTHPDNKARVESQAPGAAADKKAKSLDGSMNEAELAEFLAKQKANQVPKVVVSDLSSKTQAITADNLAEIGLPPATFNPPEDALSGDAAPTGDETASGIKFETLGETVPFVKEAGDAKPKAAKKAAKKVEVETPPDTGAWS